MIFARTVIYFPTDWSCCDWTLECQIHFEPIVSLDQLLCLAKLLASTHCKIVLGNRCIGVFLNLLLETGVHRNLLALIVMIYRSMADTCLWLITDSKNTLLVILLIELSYSSLWRSSCSVNNLRISVCIWWHRSLDWECEPWALENIFNVFNWFKSTRWILIINANRLIWRDVRWNFIIYVDLRHILG